jgi:hypothetical protein
VEERKCIQKFGEKILRIMEFLGDNIKIYIMGCIACGGAVG